MTRPVASRDPLYKVLLENGRSPYAGKPWPLPNGKPGEWLTVEGDLIPCERGIHLCRRGDLVSWLGPVIWEVESPDEPLIAEDKIVVRKARLLRRVEAWGKQVARLFAADCAERALAREAARGRTVDARSTAAVEVARRHAMGQATDEELSAAWAAEWDAVRAAARAAEWDAVRAAAAAAEWDAARAAAGAADVAAEWDAEWDAERAWQTRRLFARLEGRDPETDAPIREGL